MASSSESYHEPLSDITTETRYMHQALSSLQEELEAVDWYRQRADACEDPELKDILLHNMREEIEHACMVLEWLRRHNRDFADQMETYLFTSVPITRVEEAQEKGEDAEVKQQGGDAGEDIRRFTIGDLKKKKRP